MTEQASAARLTAEQLRQECLKKDGGGDDNWICVDCVTAGLSTLLAHVETLQQQLTTEVSRCQQAEQKALRLQQEQARLERLNPRQPVSDEESRALLQTTDGSKWANAFCRATGFPDEGWALTWFCNAIMAQYDESRRQATAAESALQQAREARPWIVTLTCCGREDGIFRAATWEEAEAFRDSYTSGPGVNPHGYSGGSASGHQRSAIISKEDAER